MNYQYVPYLWITILLSFIIISLIVYAWKNQTVLGARYFLLTLILVEVWISAQGFEMAALNLSTKLIWANIQYIPIMLTPITYFYLTLQFTRSDIWLQRRWFHALLLIAPLLINIILWTRFSYLIRQNVSLDMSGTFPTISKTYGPLFWVFASFNYLITILTFINLLISLKEKAPIYRKQILFLMTALFFPILSNLLYISGMNPFRVDTTPVFFGFSAMMISLGIFRYRLFDIIPIAHSTVIYKMKIGMIVLDNEGRILDINPAAERMMNIKSKNLIGCSMEEKLGGLPELIQICKADRETVCEIDLNDSGTHFYYEVSLTKVKNFDQQPIGQLLQIYDISERKIAENMIQHAAH
ncbi:MAG: histidine kinase N-terminal 7TM domain-containing protein, partial [Bacillota bacterium]